MILVYSITVKGRGKFIDATFGELSKVGRIGGRTMMKGSNLLLALIYYFLYLRHLVSELLIFYYLLFNSVNYTSS